MALSKSKSKKVKVRKHKQNDEKDKYWLPTEMWHEILGFVDKSHHHVIVSVNHLFYDHVMHRRQIPECSADLKRAARLGHRWDIVGIEIMENPIIHWERGIIAAAAGNHLALFEKLWYNTLYEWSGEFIFWGDKASKVLTCSLINDTIKSNIKRLLYEVIKKSMKHKSMEIINWLVNYFEFGIDLICEILGNKFIKLVYKYNCTLLMPRVITGNGTAIQAFYGALEGGHIDLAHSLYRQRNRNLLQDPETAMISACKGGSVQLVQWIESLCPTLDSYTEYTNYAINKNHLELSKYLYSKIPPPSVEYEDKDEEDSQSVIHCCSQIGNKFMIEWIESEKIKIHSYYFSDALMVSREYFDWLSKRYPKLRTDFDEEWKRGDSGLFMDMYMDANIMKWMDRELLTQLHDSNIADIDTLIDMCNLAGREDLIPWIESEWQV